MNSPIAQYIQDQRESMESALAASLIEHVRLSTEGLCSCGDIVPLGHSFADHQAGNLLDALLAVFDADETETVPELPVADPTSTLNTAIRALPNPLSLDFEIHGDVRGWVVIRDHGNTASVISGVEDKIRLRGVLEAAVGNIITGDYES